MVSNLGRCGGPDRTDFSQFHTLSRCGGPDRTAFLTVSTLGGCGVLKELIFNSF